jgi:hypothetical protein
MSDRTVPEVLAALFFAFGAAGGHAFKLNTGLALRRALAAGVIGDPDARTFLSNLADVAGATEESMH